MGDSWSLQPVMRNPTCSSEPLSLWKSTAQVTRGQFLKELLRSFQCGGRPQMDFTSPFGFSSHAATLASQALTSLGYIEETDALNALNSSMCSWASWRALSSSIGNSIGGDWGSTRFNGDGESASGRAVN